MHSTSHDVHQDQGRHKVPLWSIFIILSVLTAVEVALYDLWVEYRFVPKYALVIMILVFTLPKAALVMTYFMHLKFEKQIIIALAIVPFVMACGVVLAILSDTLELKPQAFNKVASIGVYHAHEDGVGESDHGEAEKSEESPAESGD
jgi:caa(3)-type oxidase subunit IV